MASAAKPKSAKICRRRKNQLTTTTTASTAKTVTVGYADVTRADDTSPQIMKAWIEIKGGVNGRDDGGTDGDNPQMLSTMATMAVKSLILLVYHRDADYCQCSFCYFTIW